MKKIYFLALLVCLNGIIYSQSNYTPELLWQLKRVGEPVVSADNTKMVYPVTSYNLDQNKGGTDLYITDIAKNESKPLTSLEGHESNAQWRPDGLKIGFLSNDQLFEVNLDGTDLLQITKIEGGISNFLYSPTGKHISFTKDVKMEKTTADIYPDLPKANAKIIDGLMYRHWSSWSDENYSHLFVINYSNGLVTGEPIDILSTEKFDSPIMPFGGIECFTWSKDGESIVYASKKQVPTNAAISTNSDLYLYKIKEATTKNITKGMLGYDNNPAYDPTGKYIAWLSMAEDGYESDKNNVYLMEMSTGNKRNMTQNFSETVESFTWSDDGSKIYFIAPKDATEQIFEVTLPMPDPVLNKVKLKVNQVTNGLHDYLNCTDVGGVLIGGRQSMLYPTELFKIDKTTKVEAKVTSFNDEILKNISNASVEKRMVTTTDGKQMLTWVVYPPGFDKSKKYPTVLYCQGGPQGALSQFFSYRWNFQAMAAKGYIVVAPNRRGVTGFGKDWTDQIAGDWGGQAIQDYLSAIDDISTESYIDKNNIGCVGASYGGYSVYMLAGVHNKRFKTFIAHCGLFNMQSWYGTTEELFFANHDMAGSYWQKPTPKSYTDFNPINFVDKWDTPMLVIHGGKDFRVPESEGMQAFQALQLKNIPSKFLYFPEESHWVTKPQNSVLWQREFLGWLDKWLK
jgi:dipeptidyl aminopeptidase/acylaminoacyl peptidase